MKILVMDFSSRATRVGGEARVVAQLFKKLKGQFKTYYLGFETEYITSEGPDRILLKRKLPIGAGTRKLGLSELRIMRIAYNLVFVRRMKWFGLSQEENDRVRKLAPDVIISNSLSDFPYLDYLKRLGLKFKAIYVDHGSISTAMTSGYLSKESIPLTIGSGIGVRSGFQKHKAESLPGRWKHKCI